MTVATASDMADQGGASALSAIIDRIEILLDEELLAMRNPSVIDLRLFSERKARLLLQFTRAAGARQVSAVDARLAQSLARLRRKLEDSKKRLGLHLASARAIASIISKSVAEEESDGTYSARGTRMGLPS